MCFFVFVLLFYSLFGCWGLGLGGELLFENNMLLLKILISCKVSLNTKCALWVILMQLKMTFVRPITSVTPDLVLRSHPGDMYRCPDGGNPTTKS